MKIINYCLVFALLFIDQVAYATSSTSVKPHRGLIPQVYQASVNTNDCTQPIMSSPYVIVAGNGGANMNIHCPPDHPVMYSWKLRVGFGGIGAVSSGGGRSSITCCAVLNSYVPV